MSKINEIEAYVIGSIEGLERYRPLLHVDDYSEVMTTNAHRIGYEHALRDVQRFIHHVKNPPEPPELIETVDGQRL